MQDEQDVTPLLNRAGRGDQTALERLFPLVYEELRILAHRHRRRFPDQRAPGTGSLVHEAYLRLADQKRIDWQGRAQFFALASKAMRSILIDNARRFGRQKRAGSARHVPIEGDVPASEERSDELISLDQALTRLEKQDERQSRIVECRFFGGLTVEETAEALNISPATVKRDWDEARSWLYKEMRGDAAP
jgi:RNA polymerase sigma factor (TIGR02999 family)